MKSITIFKKWDIVLVPFPFSDLKTSKKRPGLVISPDAFNRGSDIIIAFITSQLDREQRTGDYLIKGWEKAGLPKPSLIRMKFTTIDKTIVIKKIGRLAKPDVDGFRKILVEFVSA